MVIIMPSALHLNFKKRGNCRNPYRNGYGLAASAYSDSAIKAVFKAKGRPQDNPLIVHISNLEMLKCVARDIPDVAYECAKRFGRALLQWCYLKVKK